MASMEYSGLMEAAPKSADACPALYATTAQPRLISWDLCPRCQDAIQTLRAKHANHHDVLHLVRHSLFICCVLLIVWSFETFTPGLGPALPSRAGQHLLLKPPEAPTVEFVTAGLDAGGPTLLQYPG